MAKLVMMLRIKDGIFYLKNWLERYKDIADEIVALDNGSTDGTLEMLQAHPKVVTVLQTTGYNEGRDKNLLYAAVRQRNPDWCLWLDVDELFEPQVTRAHFDAMMASRIADRYAFRRFHFADNDHFAASSYWLNYSAGPDRVLWREKPSGYFQNSLIDSPNVKGIGGLKIYSSYRIKHLGYIDKAIVDRKAAIYRDVIGDNIILQTMYMADEKKMKWIDDRGNTQVRLLNARLNALLLAQLIKKGFAFIGRKLWSDRLQPAA